jgi:hypothetical protein
MVTIPVHFSWAYKRVQGDRQPPRGRVWLQATYPLAARAAPANRLVRRTLLAPAPGYQQRGLGSLLVVSLAIFSQVRTVPCHKLRLHS